MRGCFKNRNNRKMKITSLIIKNRAKKLLPKVFLIAVSTVVLITMVDFLAYSHFHKFKCISSGNSNYAILFTGDYLSDSTYIYCDTDILCYADESSDKVVPLEIIMQKDISSSTDYITQFYKSELSEKEIVLPKKIANKYKIKRGDTVYLDVGYSTHRVDFSVKDIAEDIPSVFGHSNRYIALIGFSRQYCENVNYRTICFYAEAIDNLILGPAYIESVNFHSTATEELLDFIAFLSTYIIFLAVLSFVLIYISDREVRAQLHKLKSMGCKTKNILLIKALMNFICVCPVIFIPLIISSIYKSSLLLCIAGSILEVFLFIVFTIVDIRNYRSVIRRIG